MLRADDRAALAEAMAGFRAEGETVAFVPTMGALHAGHLSLVALAKSRADRVVASIFVNPTQFAPGEDYESYPRDTEADLAKLRAAGVDAVYLPSTDRIYADDHSTSVIVGGVGDGLETDHRPTFFHGVALIVCKLLNRVRPDIAVFGEKDYQQLCVIRRMVRDLDMGVDIVGAPIARDDHGLALSSRNRYFDAGALDTARALNRVMFGTAKAIGRGADIAKTLAQAEADIVEAGFSSVDYVSLADAETLALIGDGPLARPARLLVAAHAPAPNGPVRLIDNCAVVPATP